MSFYIYDITFLIIFSLGVGIFLWKRKKNLKREGIMYLYRTQVGVKFINYVGEKYKKTLSVLGFIGVVCGYLLMASMMYFLYKLVYIYLFVPEIVKAIKIPPLMPLIPYLPEAFKIDFLPPFYFTYWIIAIAVIAIFHEFAHGIIARLYNVKILTTGFGFLGPFLAAFVEPDEKQMEKKSKYQQIAILSAGVFTNLILAILFFLLLSVFFVLTYIPAGAIFNTYTPGIVNINSINMVGGKVVNDASAQGLLNIIKENNLSDDLILGGNGNTLELTKIVADGKTYYISIENFKVQLEKSLEEDLEKVALYEDLPAINAGLRGAIIEINGIKITDHDDLALILKDYDVGDKVKIITKDVKGKGERLEYEIILAEDSNQYEGLEGEFYSLKSGNENIEVKKKAVIGIGFMNTNQKVLGTVADMFNFFKKPATFYEPRFNIDLIVFIYNLIWWLALINLSVALINMWPVAIFDGGRMFMLSIWAITGSEKFAQIMFKLATYLILGALLVLMLGWFSAMF